MPDYPRPITQLLKLLTCLAVVVPFCALAESAEFDWQKEYAKVLSTGELEWAPEPFEYKAGTVIRYIDFVSGDDTQSGKSPEEAWQHHPWDNKATARSLQERVGNIDTYIFKGGTIYRGSLHPEGIKGSSDQPIILTSDPDWGSGKAVIQGSERVKQWVKSAHPKMPEKSKIWMADVDFLPRTLWLLSDDGRDLHRLNLARDPNWTITDRNEILSEWQQWEQPEWWTNKNVIDVDGKERHLGVDSKRLKGRDPEDIEGATVWTEWGIVMGSPYPAPVEKYDPERSGVAFGGPWTYDKSERIITGNRYFLEDKPQWLDQPGEFWVERTGRKSSRIYVRLPNDADPNKAWIEAGRHTSFLESSSMHHVEVSNLHFRCFNIHWDYNIPQWGHPDLKDAVIRLTGGGGDIQIHHNVFEHVIMPIRLDASSAAPPYSGKPIGDISIRDNVIRHTDHEAIVVEAFRTRDSMDGPLGRVEILRNNLYEIGARNLRGAHGHAVDIRFPRSSLIAGNFLYRIAGWGIAVFGGKPSRDTYSAPFSRNIITQNRVEDVLLKSNDWGGIETWQGGPHYVFNNLVINARGYKNWIYRQNKPDRIPSFGHAYYMDGSFKNYVFNNLGLGLNNEPGDPDANLTALQNIISFENTFFNNTFARFGVLMRQQQPDAGRVRVIGNAIEDVSQMVFRNADPKDVEPDPNAAHFSQGAKFAYETLAFTSNAFHGLEGDFGVFEENGATHKSLESMRESLERLNVQASDIGVISQKPLIKSLEQRDFRPTDASRQVDVSAKRVFVPWSLSSVVGEWPFRINRKNPSRIIDEHWNMTTAYELRNDYKDTPRYSLIGVNISEKDFVVGELDNWTKSALRLDGESQYLTLSDAALRQPEAKETIDIAEQDLLIEVVLSTTDADGLIAGKMDRAGYSLRLNKGHIQFTATNNEGSRLVATSGERINDGRLLHIIMEWDRDSGVRFLIDGRESMIKLEGNLLRGSVANGADFLVGGTPHGDCLDAQFEFLRIARTTLAASDTTIEELHAWQFAGPQYKDFTGKPRNFSSGAPGAIE